MVTRVQVMAVRPPATATADGSLAENPNSLAIVRISLKGDDLGIGRLWGGQCGQWVVDLAMSHGGYLT